ncbi:hypothetical protein HY408_00985 [Candidatus Gottesmanbacteria bacterium]|nr:hypothetical protein [Candidatus Gottesmanbacteria bacterium]
MAYPEFGSNRIILQIAIQESLPAEMRPVDAWQLDLAIVSISEMDQLYRQYRQLSAHMGEMGYPEYASGHLQDLGAQGVKAQQELTVSTLALLPRYGVPSSLVVQRLASDFGKAYEYLIRQRNPDNWLSDFLSTRPMFTEYIGGRPTWLG